MITVALTSIPPRFGTLADRLSAILAQNPDRLCLTIPQSYRRFPDWDGALPDLPPSVTVLRAEDLGPATKFVAASRQVPQGDLLIADDDCVYGPGWLDGFRTARARHPNDAIAASSFDTARLGLPPGGRIAQGFAGIALRPEWLPAAALSPTDPVIWVDDIWLSAHLAAAGIPMADCPDARAACKATDAPSALQDEKIDGRGRAEFNHRVARDLAHQLSIWQPDG